jgi:hypothetical protein
MHVKLTMMNLPAPANQIKNPRLPTSIAPHNTQHTKQNQKAHQVQQKLHTAHSINKALRYLSQSTQLQVTPHMPPR